MTTMTTMNIASRVFFPDPADRSPTVLVVEDEALIRVAVAAYLQESGFRVLEAGSAAEAIEILDVDLMPVDLVFSDVALPGEMNGFALAGWIHLHRPNLRVMLTSGNETHARTARTVAEETGDPFFPKPYDVTAVVSRIQRMVAQPVH